MINIFENDAFSNISMTEAINTVPYRDGRIGAMGLFETENPTTHTVGLAQTGSEIALIPMKTRNSGETTYHTPEKRREIPIYIPHHPYDDAVLAQDLSGARTLSDAGAPEGDVLETVSGVVTRKLTQMRQNHELTHEFHRLNAVKGQVVDPDANLTVVADLFDAIGATQQEFFYDLAGGGESIKMINLDIIEYVESHLGMLPYDYIHMFVGNTFFRQLIEVPEVKDAYNEQTTWRWSIEQQGTGTNAAGKRAGRVMFGDIVFENYRGGVGDAEYIAAEEGHGFPVGVPRLFLQHFGPANTIQDVNTPGKVVYAMQRAKDWDSGMDIHTESNPLMICTRPLLLIKVSAAAS